MHLAHVVDHFVLSSEPVVTSAVAAGMFAVDPRITIVDGVQVSFQIGLPREVCLTALVKAMPSRLSVILSKYFCSVAR